MNAGAQLAQLAGRRTLLLSVLGTTALLTMIGGYLTARATARELAVARLQSDFVAAVSHEFRTPLTSLRHLTELLEQGAVDSEERRQQYFAVLSSETERLHRMVEGLLEFGRVAAGRREYEFESLDPVELISNVVADFRNEVEPVGRRIALNAQSDASRRVRVDREALSRAIRNLLENAVKYSPAQSTVHVDLSGDSGRVAIAVRDEGAGISRDEQTSIFEQFVRGSAARTLNVKGTGIGLSMVRHIVRAHGGDIRLTSEVGRGSTFVVLLPAAGAADNERSRS
jgi:signal transduction histidine kinase